MNSNLFGRVTWILVVFTLCNGDRPTQLKTLYKLRDKLKDGNESKWTINKNGFVIGMENGGQVPFQKGHFEASSKKNERMTPSTLNSFNVHSELWKKEKKSGVLGGWRNEHEHGTYWGQMKGESTWGKLHDKKPTQKRLKKPLGSGDDNNRTVGTFNSHSPLKFLGNGLIKSLVVNKVMGLLDKELPNGIVIPLKHIVASGNAMINYWDKQATARDGKTPRIMEVLGFGINTLKGLRDGKQVQKSDPVAQLTSPSQLIFQGLLTIRKLTSRVLGYESGLGSNIISRHDQIQSRDGYGGGGWGGGWGWGHHASYGNYLDPYVILSTLGFGVFLFNVIFNLLNAAASGRSIDVMDLDVPLHLSDVVFNPKALLGTPVARVKRATESVMEDTFDQIVDNAYDFYHAYETVSDKPHCMKVYFCRLAINQDLFQEDQNPLLQHLYDIGLDKYVGPNTGQFIRKIQQEVNKGNEVDCDKYVPNCKVPDL